MQMPECIYWLAAGCRAGVRLLPLGAFIQMLGYAALGDDLTAVSAGTKVFRFARHWNYPIFVRISSKSDPFGITNRHLLPPAFSHILPTDSSGLQRSKWTADLPIQFKTGIAWSPKIPRAGISTSAS